ncbi:MAG TPA: glycosyltransferase, partial [Methanosarcina sp.]|nr:glycosyltransferase [Methanosarcina sp.]
IDIDKVLTLSSESIALSPLDHSKHEQIFVSIGRLEKVKGFDILIEAISLMKSKECYFFIIGEGSEESSLKEKVHGLALDNRIHFLGFKPNPYPYLKNADAFILSSRVEGFPNVILEALACEIPVIAVPAPGGTVEILEGCTGCKLATSVSALALAQAIDEWISDAGIEVPVKSVDRYSLGKIIPCYEELFLNSIPLNHQIAQKR